MALSKKENRTVQQFPKNSYVNFKRSIFSVATGSLFLIAGMQTVNAATCAPDVSYLIPILRIQDLKSDAKSSIQKNFIDGYKSGLCCSNGGHEDPVVKTQREFEGYIREANVTLEHPEVSVSPKEYTEDWILINKERIKQLNCMKNSGQVATSSADFDTNGNYKGSTQQASNKKSKSGKGNNQEQVATAESNANGINSADSNSDEPLDSKSKGKEFAKDEKRLHANACVAVQRDKNKVPAFKNICPYPIEVVWCANSKEDPNQCDRGWYGQWNFGVGHSEPINATSATHWVVAACKGGNSLFMNEELKRNRKVRCVKWDN